MSRSGKHLGFLFHLDEMRFKIWLDGNSLACLKEIGIREGQTVLDIGCGSGTFTIPSATLVGETGIIYALDIDDRSLEKLRSKAEKAGLKNIRILHTSANEKIKIDDNSIDHVLLIDVLQEVSHKDLLFEEVKRVLRTGGILTVFPMHITDDEVIKLAKENDIELLSRKFDDRLLVFIKK
jgi:demethylmenaquinone methyltransferase/2-methoxy-6-polyprenyl-1,4-benzoquinol methylase